MIDTDPAIVGDLTPAEVAAMTAVAILGDSCHGLGYSKWTMVQSRLKVAAARAATGVDIWTEIAPHLRSLGGGNLNRADAIELLEALAAKGCHDELQHRLDLAVLRVRAQRTPKRAAPEPETPIEPMTQESLL